VVVGGHLWWPAATTNVSGGWRHLRAYVASGGVRANGGQWPASSASGGREVQENFLGGRGMGLRAVDPCGFQARSGDEGANFWPSRALLSREARFELLTRAGLGGLFGLSRAVPR
jgi:hypothetical protein